MKIRTENSSPLCDPVAVVGPSPCLPAGPTEVLEIPSVLHSQDKEENGYFYSNL